MASCLRTSSPCPAPQAHIHSSYEHLEVEYVTKYSTLLTLPGTNPSLPPVLLMSHQDTVPVQTATIGEWHHPPFEGRVTDPKDDLRGKRWIYGRGALDCKGLVTSELNALERHKRFNNPKRWGVDIFDEDGEENVRKIARERAEENKDKFTV